MVVCASGGVWCVVCHGGGGGGGGVWCVCEITFGMSSTVPIAPNDLARSEPQARKMASEITLMTDARSAQFCTEVRYPRSPVLHTSRSSCVGGERGRKGG